MRMMAVLEVDGKSLVRQREAMHGNGQGMVRKT